MRKPADLTPTGTDSEIDCDRCGERVLWLTETRHSSMGVCACPWTSWVDERTANKVYRSVPEGYESDVRS